MKVFFLGLFLVGSLLAAEIPEKEMVVVIPSYNNQKWYAHNLSSVLEQNYHNFRVIYVDDCSTDGTAQGVEALARAYRPDAVQICTFDDSSILENVEKFREMLGQQPVFFTLVTNTSRRGALENLYLAIHSCKGHEIIITVDGDDWLYDKEVLQRINEVYSSKEIWMTHGKYIEYPNRGADWYGPIPPEIIAGNAIRQTRGLSHLRTFYAWLFKKIALQDLLFEGKFFSMTWDYAMMFPMFEMAAERHHFFSTPTYVYNRTNPLNDDKVDQKLQGRLDQYIRRQNPYQRLENAGEFAGPQ